MRFQAGDQVKINYHPKIRKPQSQGEEGVVLDDATSLWTQNYSKEERASIYSLYGMDLKMWRVQLEKTGDYILVPAEELILIGRRK